MRYVVKLENFPITWDVDANSDNEAIEKGWNEIRCSVPADSIRFGGFIVVKKTYEMRLKFIWYYW